LKYGDASIFASSIPVLSIKIFPSEPFMHGSSSTGLDVKGKSAFWTYNSLRIDQKLFKCPLYRRYAVEISIKASQCCDVGNIFVGISLSTLTR
jgi:hypothetical protein